MCLSKRELVLPYLTEIYAFYIYIYCIQKQRLTKLAQQLHHLFGKVPKDLINIFRMYTLNLLNFEQASSCFYSLIFVDVIQGSLAASYENS